MNLKTQFYITAIRKRIDSNTLLDDVSLLKDFKLVKNNLFFWRADPFLLTVGENDYLFVEIGNKITGKGSLAFARIDNGKIKHKFKRCAFERFHMSFPNVFVLDGKICMIPETKRDNCLALYSCSNLNEGFKKTKVLIGNVSVVDSTFFNNYLLCYNNSTDLPFLQFYKTKSFLESSYELFLSIEDKNKKLRAAGNIFIAKNGDLILPTQNCEKGYGKGLIFNKLFLDDLKTSISPMLEISCEKASKLLKRKVVGIHTYNSNQQYEVVDIKVEKFSIIGLIGKIFNRLK